LKNKKIGVLFSGGLDSAALVANLLEKGYEVWPVYVSCGLTWEKREIYWARKFIINLKGKRIQPLAIVHLALENAYKHNWSKTGDTPGPTSSDDAVFLPARNLLLITKALLYLSSKKIFVLALAILKGNPFPDASRKFFRRLEKVLSSSFKEKIKILTPFRGSKKKTILQMKGYPLHLSFSCINPYGYLHCGACNKCVERKHAFKKAGIADLTKYKRT
jgi:7-cyano-7-deazaguanine synthase